MFRQGASSKDSEAAATHCGFCDALLLGDAEHYFYVFSFCSLYYLLTRTRETDSDFLPRVSSSTPSVCFPVVSVLRLRRSLFGTYIICSMFVHTPNLVLLLLPSAMKISLISVNPLSFEH